MPAITVLEPHGGGGPSPRTAYTPPSFPALLFDWLITLILTLTIFDNIILQNSAGSKSGVYVEFYGYERIRTMEFCIFAVSALDTSGTRPSSELSSEVNISEAILKMFFFSPPPWLCLCCFCKHVSPWHNPHPLSGGKKNNGGVARDSQVSDVAEQSKEHLPWTSQDKSAPLDTQDWYG